MMSRESHTTHDHVCWGAGDEHEAHELRVSGLSVRYRQTLALSGVDFHTHCGRSVALIGPNGAGKSTLLKALAGILKPSSGRILWRGAPLVKSSREIAYLPQRGDIDWSFPVTVQGLVEMGRYPNVGWWRRFSEHDEEMVRRALRTMQIEELQERQINALSGGQQQRVFIARALAQEAHVLLLDEPFAGLDQNASDTLMRLLVDLAGEGRLIIASHHDLGTVKSVFDRVLLLNRTQQAFGTVEEVFETGKVEETYATVRGGPSA